LDINENLPSLLREVVKIEGNFLIRVGMGNPQYMKSFIPELVEVYKNDKIMKFLHIPVQSGSDKVLKEMKRGHTVEDFKNIVKEFRNNIPDMNIATDVIVGYPTETKADFLQTKKLIEEIKPEVINISKFASRPGTEAAKLKPMRTQVVKYRSGILDKVVEY